MVFRERARNKKSKIVILIEKLRAEEKRNNRKISKEICEEAL